MKHLLQIVALVALTVGCIANDTKKAVQFPPAQLAWPAVEADYLRGIADGVDDGDLTAAGVAALTASGSDLAGALAERDTSALRSIPWVIIMRKWADRGIADKLEDKEIGPTVAVSLTEQVKNFTEIIQSLQRTR